MPCRDIDHINQDKSDNRWNNLRDVANDENHKNLPLYANNKSGVAGISFRKDTNKWSAQISDDGKIVRLGCYKSKQEAIDKRRQAEIEFGYHANHGTGRV